MRIKFVNISIIFAMILIMSCATRENSQNQETAFDYRYEDRPYR